MRGSVRPHDARHAVLPTFFARDSDSSPMASQVTGGGGFDVAVAQLALHARGRFGVEGRIAQCPRLQQIGSRARLSGHARQHAGVATADRTRVSNGGYKDESPA